MYFYYFQSYLQKTSNLVENTPLPVLIGLSCCWMPNTSTKIAGQHQKDWFRSYLKHESIFHLACILQWDCSPRSPFLSGNIIIQFLQNVMILLHIRWIYADLTPLKIKMAWTWKWPKSSSLENEILPLSWYISKSFYRIRVVEVWKS